MVPEGNSIANAELIYMGVMRKGLKEETAFITLPFLSINKTSIANLIKKVCMELQGFKIRAHPVTNLFLPKSPCILLKEVSASFASLAKRVPLV